MGTNAQFAQKRYTQQCNATDVATRDMLWHQCHVAYATTNPMTRTIRRPSVAYTHPALKAGNAYKLTCCDQHDSFRVGINPNVDPRNSQPNLYFSLTALTPSTWWRKPNSLPGATMIFIIWGYGL